MTYNTRNNETGEQMIARFRRIEQDFARIQAMSGDEYEFISGGTHPVDDTITLVTVARMDVNSMKIEVFMTVCDDDNCATSVEMVSEACANSAA